MVTPERNVDYLRGHLRDDVMPDEGAPRPLCEYAPRCPPRIDAPKDPWEIEDSGGERLVIFRRFFSDFNEGSRESTLLLLEILNTFQSFQLSKYACLERGICVLCVYLCVYELSKEIRLIFRDLFFQTFSSENTCAGDARF